MSSPVKSPVMESPTRNIPHLQLASPERINRMPPSPSASHNDPFVTSPGASSVQGKVAQFNSLSKEALQRRKDSEAALRRAVLGREEAESETRRLRDENGALRQKLEEARARDQRVAKKFETFSEERRKLVEHQHKVQKVSDEEVRRARKEAFKFSSALVKAQEDLQKARSHLEELNDQANIERNRGKKYQQEAFDAKLALSDIEEELEALKLQVKTVEEERNVLKTTLNDEQIARIAAEGRIPLPTTESHDEFASPRKSKQRRISRRVSSRRESLKENMDPVLRASNDIFDIMWAAEEGDEFAVAKRNLWVEEKRRQEAEIMIKYLKSEYERRPQVCSCSTTSSLASAPLASPVDIISTDLPVLENPMEATPSFPAFESSVPANGSPVEPPVTLDVDSVLEEDTVLHHSATEAVPAMQLVTEPITSPLVHCETPSFMIHEDSPNESIPTDIQPVASETLAPVLLSTSPSAFELEGEDNKENSEIGATVGVSPSSRTISIANTNLSTGDTSILSIKSEDVDDSEHSHSSALTPRPPPNQLLQVEMTAEKEKIQRPELIREIVQKEAILDDLTEAVQTPVNSTSSAALKRVTPAYSSSTTTTSVPLKGDSVEKSSAKNYPFSPGATMTREQALEAIKQRRRRAKSIHDGKSGKAFNELLRRDVSTKSAPA